ncbi:MAG: GAF and ANTAR domain-containing protein [Mycobacterium sp.]
MAERRDYDGSIRNAMAELISGIEQDAAVERTLSRVTAAAVDLVDGIDYADVMVIADGRSQSVSATAPLVIDLDAVQISLGQGPCLAAAVGGAMILCPDMREEQRWPCFAEAAVTAGVHSMLSFQLISHGNGAGALNLFGRAPRTTDPAAEAIGALLATVATIALMTADRGKQFASALASRDEIGQAKGILMNHFRIDATRAFDMLRRLSQDGNIPLRTIAKRIIESDAL